MSTTVYFDAPPSQDAWIDFTLAVTEMFWLLPASARPAGIDAAGQLFAGGAFAGPGIRLSSWPADNLPVQEIVPGDEASDFFNRLVLILIHNLCPGCVRIERELSSQSGWEQPLIWLRHHLQRPALSAPGDVDAAAMGDSSIRLHLERYRDSLCNAEIPYHWRVITWMDEVLSQRRKLTQRVA